MDEKIFGHRLSELRLDKGVSARDMSLSLGQNPGYINNIESGRTLPSMSSFFYICEYLNVTPAEFFQDENKSPERIRHLLYIAKKLSPKQLDNIIDITEDLTKK